MHHTILNAVWSIAKNIISNNVYCLKWQTNSLSAWLYKYEYTVCLLNLGRHSQSAGRSVGQTIASQIVISHKTTTTNTKWSQNARILTFTFLLAISVAGFALSCVVIPPAKPPRRKDTWNSCCAPTSPSSLT